MTWDEHKHKRGQPENAGQFGPGGGSKKSTPDEAGDAGGGSGRKSGKKVHQALLLPAFHEAKQRGEAEAKAAGRGPLPDAVQTPDGEVLARRTGVEGITVQDGQAIHVHEFAYDHQGSKGRILVDASGTIRPDEHFQAVDAASGPSVGAPAAPRTSTGMKRGTKVKTWGTDGDVVSATYLGPSSTKDGLHRIQYADGGIEEVPGDWISTGRAPVNGVDGTK